MRCNPPGYVRSPARAGALSQPISRRAVALALAGGFVALAALAAAPARAQAPLSPQTLTGVWQGQEVSPIGTWSVQVIFFANGTYRRQNQGGQLMTYDVGTYTIVQNWIHFQLQDYGPRYYMNRPMTRPMSDTYVVNRFDGRTLQATSGGTSSITLQRVQ